VPESFRILRQLLSRLDDEQTGRVKIDGLQVQVPAERLKQARLTAEVLGDEVWNKFPFVPGARPVVTDKIEMILNRSWRPALSITGIDGLPPLESAGNVLRPTPPARSRCAFRAGRSGRRGAGGEGDAGEGPPYGTRVAFEGEKASTGWDAPPLAQWLSSSVDRASRSYFGKPPMAIGEGGTIPSWGCWARSFGRAVPHHRRARARSNAHGPNEFLHIPTASG